MARSNTLALWALSVCLISCGVTRETTEAKRDFTRRCCFAYWLNPDDAYVSLLILKLPVEDLAGARLILGESPTYSDGVLVKTYSKDSIWNTDMRPFKGVTSLSGAVSSKMIEVNGEHYQFETAEMSDVIALLENPAGTVRIHRMFAPLAGMEDLAADLLTKLKNSPSAQTFDVVG